MKRCAFLTLSDPTGWVIDDDLAAEPLRALGWELDTVPWDREGVEWEQYGIVVIRSTWDWFHAPDRFLHALAGIGARTRLENSLRIVEWNLRKTYLRELASRGVATVPTIFLDRLAPGELAKTIEEHGLGEIVLKPVIGANAEGAHRIPPRRVEEAERYFEARALMVQPFVPAVLDEGESSLFYFDGEYSHAVRKRPKAGDFRVQEEHGGAIESIDASAELRAAAETTLAALPELPLYARVDLVRGDGDAFWLMELELVEPSLYLRKDPGAPERLATAIVRRAGRIG